MSVCQRWINSEGGLLRHVGEEEFTGSFFQTEAWREDRVLREQSNRSQPHRLILGTCTPWCWLWQGCVCCSLAFPAGTAWENSTLWKDAWPGVGWSEQQKATGSHKARLCRWPQYTSVLSDPPGLESQFCHQGPGNLGHTQNLLKPLKKPQLWTGNNKKYPPFFLLFETFQPSWPTRPRLTSSDSVWNKENTGTSVPSPGGRQVLTFTWKAQTD